MSNVLPDSLLDELFFAAKKHVMQEAFRRTARAILAASPVSQPAVAPIGSADEAAEREYFRRWENELPKLDGEAWDRAAPAPAPSPADERDDLIGRLLLAGRHPDFAICMEAAKALRGILSGGES